MRKYLLIVAAVFSLMFLSFSNGGEHKKPFEGLVIYTVSKVDQNNPGPMPKEYELYIKGSRWRRVMPDDFGGNIEIGDTNTPEKVIRLWEIQGAKFLLLSSYSGEPYNRHYIDSVKQHLNYVIYPTETKAIQGYTCKKLYQKTRSIQSTRGTVRVPVYYTDEIADYFTPLYLPGLPLELKITPIVDTVSTYTVSSITEKALPDSLFIATPYYKPLKVEDIPRVTDSLMNVK